MEKGTVRRLDLRRTINVKEARRVSDSEFAIAVNFEIPHFAVRGESYISNDGDTYKVHNDLQYQAVEDNEFCVLLINERVEDMSRRKEITDEMISNLKTFTLKLNEQKSKGNS